MVFISHQWNFNVAHGYRRKSINALENGVYILSTVLALKIARILNCKVEDIFLLPLK